MYFFFILGILSKLSVLPGKKILNDFDDSIQGQWRSQGFFRGGEGATGVRRQKTLNRDIVMGVNLLFTVFVGLAFGSKCVEFHRYHLLTPVQHKHQFPHSDSFHNGTEP